MSNILPKMKQARLRTPHWQKVVEPDIEISSSPKYPRFQTSRSKTGQASHPRSSIRGRERERSRSDITERVKLCRYPWLRHGLLVGRTRRRVDENVLPKLSFASTSWEMGKLVSADIVKNRGRFRRHFYLRLVEPRYYMGDFLGSLLVQKRRSLDIRG